jgi:hypothetical protein
VTFEGELSGTATIVHNVTWIEQGDGTPFNRTFNMSGDRSISFSDYSNVENRKVESGTIHTEIFNGTFQSSTASGNNPLDGETITRRATNVNKHISGTVEVFVNGANHTCTVDLTVTVIERITEWTYSSSTSPILYNPEVIKRNVHINGTIRIDDREYTIDRVVDKVLVE